MPGDAELVEYDDFDQSFPGRGFGPRNRDIGTVDGSPLYYRAGTAEPRGIRVTIRGDLRDAILTQGNGFLAVRRGRCYMIPLAFIRDWLGVKLEQQQTVDIRVDTRNVQLLGPVPSPADMAPFQGAGPATG
jgi:hypothetical protein